MNVLRGDILQLLPFMIVAGAIVFVVQLALLLRSKKITLKLLPIHIILIIGVTTILLTLFSYFVGQHTSVFYFVLALLLVFSPIILLAPLVGVGLAWAVYPIVRAFRRLRESDPPAPQQDS